MRRAIRVTVGAVIVLHGLVHLLGVVEGFGWADVDELTEPISAGMATVWLAAAISVTTAGVLLVAGTRWWWVVGAPAAVVSQAVILTSWSDAKAGTLANIVLVVAAVHGYLAEGPTSLRAEYRRRARHAAATRDALETAPILTPADLSHLPRPVAAYVTASGAVGRPRVVGFRATVHGRIRNGPDDTWMRWTGEQVNTVEPMRRVFSMDATMHGLPADVLHVYEDGRATMRVKAGSVVTVVDLDGPQLDEAETVTFFNDLCLLAPATLVDAPVDWTTIDDHHVRATYRGAGHVVSATLTFDDDGDLVDFTSDDRSRLLPDHTAVRQRWSTPIDGHRAVRGRRVVTSGHGWWHPDDAPPFEYIEFCVDDIAYLTRPREDSAPLAPTVATGWSDGDAA